MNTSGIADVVGKSSHELYGVYPSDIAIQVPGPAGTERISQFIFECASSLGEEHPELISNGILPKSIVFCGLVGTGMLEPDQLEPLINIISSVYLLDQFIDHAPNPERYSPVLTALINNQEPNDSTPAIVSLIREQIAQFLPEHQREIRKLAYQDVVLQQYQLRRLSLSYFIGKDTDLNTDPYNIAKMMVTNVGLQLVANGTYMMLIKHDKVSEPLQKVVNRQEYRIRVLEAFLRICDDYGDVGSDYNENLNVFNERNLLSAVLGFCSIPYHSTEPDDKAIQRIFQTSKRLAQLPRRLSNDQQIYLKLLLRVMEGGIINAIGDVHILESEQTLDPEAQQKIGRFKNALLPQPISIM